MILSGFFHWFYCQPVSSVLILAVLSTVLFLLLDRKLEVYRWWKAVLACLLAAAVFVTLWQTVLGRTPGPQKPPVLSLFASYRQVFGGGNPEILRSNLMNVLFFYPAGVFSAALFCRGKRPWLGSILVVLCFFLLSAGIEYLQYRLCLGIFEADDIFHNTLGVLLAQLLCPGIRKLSDGLCQPG